MQFFAGLCDESGRGVGRHCGAGRGEGSESHTCTSLELGLICDLVSSTDVSAPRLFKLYISFLRQCPQSLPICPQPCRSTQGQRRTWEKQPTSTALSKSRSTTSRLSGKNSKHSKITSTGSSLSLTSLYLPVLPIRPWPSARPPVAPDIQSRRAWPLGQMEE